MLKSYKNNVDFCKYVQSDIQHRRNIRVVVGHVHMKFVDHQWNPEYKYKHGHDLRVCTKHSDHKHQIDRMDFDIVY